MTGPPTRLEQALGHTFGDRNLLERALTHRSHDPAVSNERLEFLGDSVLEFVITGYLYASSGLDEGVMTKGRGSGVSRAAPLVPAQIAAPGERDYKTRLQEVLAQQGQTPSYVSEGEGPEHARVFFATVAVGGRVLGTGAATSKKRARQGP